MSVPFGTPPQAPQPQPAPPGQSSSGPNLKFFLTLVAAGVGLVGYVLGFVDEQAASVISGVAGFCLIAASTLAGLRVLPKAPNTLYAAIPLAVYAALGLLQGIVSGSTNLVAVVLLVLAILQLGAVVGVLLMDAEIIVPPAPKSAPPPPPGFPQSAQFPQPGQGPPAQPGQFGQPPQTGWGPQVGGQPQPGQFGQQPGGWKPSSGGQPLPGPGQPGGWNPQSGGFPAPGQPPGQGGQPGGGQPGSGQPGSGQPGGQPSSGQPGGGQTGQTGQGGQNSGSQSGGGTPGTQHMPPPGTPPRGF